MTSTTLNTDHDEARETTSQTAPSAPSTALASDIGGDETHVSPLSRVRGLVATVMALAIATVGALASPASASQGNYDLDAYCNANHAITAWAPDLTHDDGSWTIVWAPMLYRYSSTYGWVKYLGGPTQTEYGGSWVVQSVYFTNLPTGYYQVRDTYAWIHNGVKTSYGVFEPVIHRLNGAAYYYGSSVATLRYSTASYCYMS